MEVSCTDTTTTNTLIIKSKVLNALPLTKLEPFTQESFGPEWWSSNSDIQKLIFKLLSLIARITTDLLYLVVNYCRLLPDIDTVEKSSWMPIYDEVEEEIYYTNKITTESVWEIPDGESQPLFITCLNLKQAKLNNRNIRDGLANTLAYMLSYNSTVTSLLLMDNMLEDNDIQLLIKGFEKNSTITDINLSENKIGDIGAIHLAELLKIKSMLQSFDIRSNLHIGKLGANTISEVVYELKTMEQFSEIPISYFNNNPKRIFHLNQLKLGNTEALVIAKYLRDYSYLIELYLDENHIGDVGIDAIAESLKKNSSLKILDLQHNKIQKDGGESLAKILKENSVLTKLDLGYNEIGKLGAEMFGHYLKDNITLQELALSTNEIGAPPAQSLGECLKTNSTLKILRLGTNKIGDDGAEGIAAGLMINSTVTILYLRTNDIGDRGAIAIANALKTNTNITDISLNENEITDIGANALVNALYINSSLVEFWIQDNKYTNDAKLKFLELETKKRFTDFKC